jgi:pimeloyl-ACP methyl ester carboxylesterase
VIIGGFLDPDLGPSTLRGFFERSTLNTTIVSVSLFTCTSFDECRKAIIDAVDQKCPSNDPHWTPEVDVVGMSMGGLAARYAAAPGDSLAARRLRIARLFTIASPHTGATLASAGFTDFHRDMRAGSKFLKSLAQTDAREQYEIEPYVLLGDEIVGVQNAAPLGVTPWWLPNDSIWMSHFAALVDDRILADILKRLRGETPFTSSPPTTLP